MTLRKKLLIVIACHVVILSTLVGSLAWLTSKSESTIIQFQPSKVLTNVQNPVTLEKGESGSLIMVAGQKMEQKLAVMAEVNIDCYLFMQVEKSDNFDAFLTYAIAEGWTALEGENGVYYREVKASKEDQAFPVLKDNVITVLQSVTTDMMNGLKADDPATEENECNYPKLTVTSFACQKQGFASAKDAWKQLTPPAESAPTETTEATTENNA